MKIKALVLGTGLAVGGFAASGHASGGHGAATLGEMAAEADAVAHGVVIAVDYRLSDAAGSDGRLPHTFVTYQVLDTVHGHIEGETVTLRFIGGPDGQGGFMALAGAPTFDMGDEDVLFIRGNGEYDCPLVDCASGRLRIHAGQVYGEHALPVVGLENGRLKLGDDYEPALLTTTFPAPTFDGLLKNPDVAEALRGMSNAEIEELRRLYEHEAPKTIEVSTRIAESADTEIKVVAERGVEMAVEGEPEKQAGAPVLFQSLRRELAAQVGRLGDAGDKPTVRSLDPATRFSIRPLPVEAPPPEADSDPAAELNS